MGHPTIRRASRRRCGALLTIALAACHSGAPVAGRVPVDSAIASLEPLRAQNPRLYRVLMTVSVLQAQGELNLLGFGPGRYTGVLDAATRDATRRYEAARGLPVTGNPFAATTHPRLQADAERLLRLATPWANQRNFDAGDWSETVEADGPWVAPGVENPAAVTVECYRDELQCMVAETEYGSHGIAPLVDWYDVATWDAAEIRTKPVDDRCRRTVLTLNRIEESVTLTRSLLSDDSACIALQRDTSWVYDRSAHLATDSDVAAIRLHNMGVAFDSLLDLPAPLRRSLAVPPDSGPPAHADTSAPQARR
jgi:hypothetical protein